MFLSGPSIPSDTPSATPRTMRYSASVSSSLRFGVDRSLHTPTSTVSPSSAALHLQRESEPPSRLSRLDTPASSSASVVSGSDEQANDLIGPKRTSVAMVVRRGANMPLGVWLLKGGSVATALRAPEALSINLAPTPDGPVQSRKLLRKLSHRVDFLGRRLLLKRNLFGTQHRQASMWMRASGARGAETVAVTVESSEGKAEGKCMWTAL